MAICSRRATSGQNIIIDPKFCAISVKEYSVPLPALILNGGGPKGGSPPTTLPEN